MMNHSEPWYHHQSEALKAVKKWVTEEISLRNSEDSRVYEYNCMLPSSKERSGQVCLRIIVDEEVTTALQSCGVLNQYELATKLYAVKIPREPSSFYHSVSVSLWGFLDSENILYNVLKDSLRKDQHWKMRLNQLFAEKVQGASKDVSEIIDGLFSPLHIFFIANVIKRPVIVVSDEEFNDTTQGIDNFSGIYLPLMMKPIQCSKTPIFLSYYKCRFWPLVMEAPSNSNHNIKCQIMFPLVKNKLNPLPFKFLHDSEELKKACEILQDYLILKETDVKFKDGLIQFLQSDYKTLPEERDTMIDFKKFCDNNQVLDGYQNQTVQYVSEREAVVYPNEVYYHGAPHIEPSAPLSEDIPFEKELHSMTNEICISCKSYRCSFKIFPYCHECFDRKEKVMNMPYSPTFDPPQMFSINPQVGDCGSSSPNLTLNNQTTKSTVPGNVLTENKIGNKNMQDPNLTSIGKVPQHGDLGQSRENLIGHVSHQSYPVKCEITKCASPVCDEQIHFPEKLCPKCIKVLKIHHLSNCHQACCQAYKNKAASHYTLESNEHRQQPRVDGVRKEMTLITEEMDLNVEKDRQCHAQMPDKPICCASASMDYDTSLHSCPAMMVTSATSADDQEYIRGVILQKDCSRESDLMKCKTPSCSYMGNENNLCEECYCKKTTKRSQSYDSSLVSANSDLKMATYHDLYCKEMENLENTVKVGAKKCKTPSCPHFGNKERSDFCNSCYKKMRITNHPKYSGCHNTGEDRIDGFDDTNVTGQYQSLCKEQLDGFESIDSVKSADSDKPLDIVSIETSDMNTHA